MELSKEILEERERIKALIQFKIEAIEKGKYRMRAKVIPISILKLIIFRIDNPDYVRKKYRGGNKWR